MRISLRKKVSISVLFTFLVLCLGLFAHNGAGTASAHGSTSASASKITSISVKKIMITSTGASSVHHSSECSSAAHFFAAPCKVTETTSGNVSFVLIGQRLIPLMFYTITFPTLSQACKQLTLTNASPVELTDLNGRFNTAISAALCIRGTYAIELQEDYSPFTVYSTHITIKAP